MYAALVFSICLIVSTQTKKNPNVSQKTISIDKAKIDAFITGVLECQPSIIALSLAIVQLNNSNDKTLASYNRAYGNLTPPYKGSSSEPPKADQYSRFCIGSVTKQFTAATTGLALEKLGKDFDARLIDVLGEEGKFFGDKSVFDGLPTVRDILSHRMSIPGYTGALLAGLPGNRTEYWKKLHKLSDSNETNLSSKYRSSFEYNNWMVALAGYITERIRGRSWESVINETYFRLLPLRNATFVESTDFKDNFALPAYRVANESDPKNFTWLPIDTDYISSTMYVSAPAGAICMSSVDMLTYMEFVLSSNITCNETNKWESWHCSDKELLNDKIKQTMREVSNYIPQPETDARNERVPFIAIDNYALGWTKGYYRGYEMVGHSGGAFGYLTEEILFPKSKIGIFVSTTNGYSDSSYATHIAFDLFDLITGESDDVAFDICELNKSDSTLPNPDCMAPFPECFETKNYTDLEQLNGTYSHEVFGDIYILYNKSANEANRLRLYYGRFTHGVLCPQVKDNEKRNRFRLYFDVNSPLWLNNDLKDQEIDTMFTFERDNVNRGTRLVFSGLEQQAPVEKQTFLKRDYHL